MKSYSVAMALAAELNVSVRYSGRTVGKPGCIEFHRNGCLLGSRTSWSGAARFLQTLTDDEPRT